MDFPETEQASLVSTIEAKIHDFYSRFVRHRLSEEEVLAVDKICRDFDKKEGIAVDDTSSTEAEWGSIEAKNSFTTNLQDSLNYVPGLREELYSIIAPDLQIAIENGDLTADQAVFIYRKWVKVHIRKSNRNGPGGYNRALAKELLPSENDAEVMELDELALKVSAATVAEAYPDLSKAEIVELTKNNRKELVAMEDTFNKERMNYFKKDIKNRK